MPIQRAEDAGRNLRNIWHGPTNAWRWPFDATYTEWGVGIAAFLGATVVLWWVVPLGIGMAFCSYALARTAAGRIHKDTLAAWFRTEPARAPRRARRVFTAGLLLFVLMFVSDPSTWLLPAPWWLGIPMGLLVAVRTVRAARPYIDSNRPVGYWISTLLGIARRPARARREATVIEFAAGPTMSGQTLDDEVLDFLSDVAAIDPKEVTVPMYRERTAAVEALLWDSRTGRRETCENVVAALKARGVPVEIPQVTRRERRLAGGEYVYERESVVLRIAGTLVPDDTVILLRPTEEAHEVTGFVPRQEFGRRFEMVTPRAECPAHEVRA